MSAEKVHGYCYYALSHHMKAEFVEMLHTRCGVEAKEEDVQWAYTDSPIGIPEVAIDLYQDNADGRVPVTYWKEDKPCF